MIINKSLIQGDFSLLVTQPLSNNANLISVPIPFSLSPPPLFMEDISHCIVLLELSSPYTCSSFKPSLEYLSHHLSICPITLLLQLFLSCDLPKNTIQRSTPHKCGHNNRYNAFNVVVAAFLLDRKSTRLNSSHRR